MTLQKQNQTKDYPFLKLKELWGIPLFLLLFGIVEVFSASRFKGVELKNNEYYFAIIHILWVVIAIAAGAFAYFMRAGFWKLTAYLVYGLTIVLLVGVYFIPAVNGAHRWFPINDTINLQPSEFAKLTIVIFGAFLMNRLGKRNLKTYSEHLKQFLFPLALYLGIPMFLVVLQPDLGTTIVMFVSFAVMYMMRENKFLQQDLTLIAVIGSIALIFFIFKEAYRLDRVETYIHLITTGEVQDEFGTGYQVRNILIGVGSGGLWGTGIGQSRQRYGYLVETTAFTDSISAVVFEELGYFLSLIFIISFVVYIIRISMFAEMQKDEFMSLALWGFVGWLFAQLFLHMSANLALMPVKGIPLPFMTYGGSSLISIGMAAGIILRFSKTST